MKNNYWDNLIEDVKIEKLHKRWVKISNWLLVVASAGLFAYCLTTLF